MKKFTTFLFVLISIAIQGQTWIDAGATWHYDWSGILPAFDKIEYVGDTVIQDKTCQTLQISSYMFTPIEYGGELLSTETSKRYTYSSGDTVFYLVNEDFYILYNFGAQVGDSWELGVDTNEFLCGRSFVEVTSTGSNEINGQMYDYIGVTTVPNSSVGFEGKIYKRFGSVDDYLFPTSRNCDPGTVVDFYMYNFTCFEDDSFPLYNVTDKDCDYLFSVGIPGLENMESVVSVYPNPASDILRISMLRPDFKLKNVKMTDMQGRILKNVRQHAIDISDLPKGLYLIHIEFYNGSKTIQKFIKE
jgi:hypothetical protein